MENNLFKHSANRLEAHLGKDSHEFTKDDIKQVVSDLNIRMVNFMRVFAQVCFQSIG